MFFFYISICKLINFLYIFRIRKENIDSTVSDSSIGSNVFHNHLGPKIDNQFCPNLSISEKTNSIQSQKNNRSRSNGFLKIFRCLAKRKFNHRKTTSNPVPAKKDSFTMTPDLEENYCMEACNVSNSSLKDIEQGALEDELTTYMKEIQNRELAMR